jgi:hypothetical protein
MWYCYENRCLAVKIGNDKTGGDLWLDLKESIPERLALPMANPDLLWD